MSEDGNEEIVIEHAPFEGRHHVHNGRPVLCKTGEEKIVLEPILKAQGDQTAGHESRHVYLRTADVDSFGRAIFRPEGV